MTYNAHIKRLMIEDRTQRHKICCDKLRARQLVPEQYLIPLIYVSDKVEYPSTYPAVIKCTHDSGSVKFCDNAQDVDAIKDKFNARLSRVYGVDKGEWAYAYAKPMIIAEKALRDATDYKFHITNGRVRWVQIIWDRGKQTKEAIFLPDGSVTNLHMDEKMLHCPDQSRHPGSKAWAQLSELALILSVGFTYVRIDLYYDGQPWFGEFTFWPRAGNYQSTDEPKFGDMLCLE